MDPARVRHVRRVLDLDGGPVGQLDRVADVRHRGHDVEPEFAVQPLLDDLHVEHPQEADAEAEAERGARLGLVGQRGIVELELLERAAEVLEVVRVGRVDAREHHRLDVAVARQLLRSPIPLVGHCVAHTRVRDVLDAADQVADLARPQFVDRLHGQLEVADLLGEVLRAGRHKLDRVALAERALLDADVDDRAAVRVERRVEDERLERGLGVARGRRDALDDALQDRLDAHARLGGHVEHVVRVAADEVGDGLGHQLRLGARQVHLVEDRDDLEVLADGHVEVRDRLRLDALRRVDDEDGALAGVERARHLVGEVDVARRVDQVEHVLLPVRRLVRHPDGVALDRDATLPFEVHRVEDLGLHLAAGERAGGFEEPVGQRRLAVVDVGDDAEVADAALVHGGRVGRRRFRATVKVPPRVPSPAEIPVGTTAATGARPPRRRGGPTRDWAPRSAAARRARRRASVAMGAQRS